MIFERIQSKGKTFEFDAEELERIEGLRKRYATDKALLLPVLWMVQEKDNFISIEAIEAIEKLLDIPAVRIYEVASFYVMFNFKPKGIYEFKVCKTLSCELNGKDKVIEALKIHTGIKELNQTSDDGLFTLSETECLGYCNQAPSMLVCSNKNSFQVSQIKVDEMGALIEKLRAQQAKKPADNKTVQATKNIKAKESDNE